MGAVVHKTAHKNKCIKNEFSKGTATRVTNQKKNIMSINISAKIN